MQIDHLSLKELNSLLLEVKQSDLTGKDWLMQAIKSKIAERHLILLHRDKNSHLSLDEPNLYTLLNEFPVEQLEKWISAFIETELTVPNELYQLSRSKREYQSQVFMKELIKDYNDSKRKK